MAAGEQQNLCFKEPALVDFASHCPGTQEEIQVTVAEQERLESTSLPPSGIHKIAVFEAVVRMLN